MKMAPTHRKNQQGFISIHMLAIIVGLLLVTGAGQYLWRNALELGSACHSVVAELGIYELDDMCMSIGTAMASLKNELSSMVGATSWGDYMDLEDFAGMLAREFSSNFGFNSPQLSGMINPSSLSGGSFNMGDLSSVVTMGSMGNNMLSSGKSDMGLRYLQKSAGAGEYGVLSQLSLGSAYANGTGGIGKNMEMSRYYNGLALNSIGKLQSSGSPQSKQLLKALPASPESLSKSLSGALR